MVQHARRVDEIEHAPDRGRLRDVGLRELDIGQAEILRHALGVAEARDAEIDRENARTARLPGEFGGGKAGPATGDEDIETLLRRALAEDGGLSRRAGLSP